MPYNSKIGESVLHDEKKSRDRCAREVKQRNVPECARLIEYFDSSCKKRFLFAFIPYFQYFLYKMKSMYL